MVQLPQQAQQEPTQDCGVSRNLWARLSLSQTFSGAAVLDFSGIQAKTVRTSTTRFGRDHRDHHFLGVLCTSNLLAYDLCLVLRHSLFILIHQRCRAAHGLKRCGAFVGVEFDQTGYVVLNWSSSYGGRLVTKDSEGEVEVDASVELEVVNVGV